MKAKHSDSEILALGIEIVSAMKASAYDVSIEQGRIMALEDTEPDRVEGLFCRNLSNEEKERCQRMCDFEKKRLHKQAMFVANATLKYLNS